jgi:hypothetical protein
MPKYIQLNVLCSTFCAKWVAYSTSQVCIVGNEAVDACAKAAAHGGSSPLAMHIKLFESPLPTSRAAVIAAGVKAFALQWREEWSISPRYARIFTFDDATPSKALKMCRLTV